MAIVSRRFCMLALSSLLTAAPLSAASAQAVEGALQRLKHLVQEQGVTIDWQDERIEGARVTLTGVSVATAEGRAPLGTFHLEGVSQVDEGYRIEEARLDRYVAGNEIGAMTAEGMVLTGVLLPDEDRLDSYGGFMFYETARLDRFTLSSEGRDLFTLSDLQTRVSPPADGSPMDFDATGAFSTDLSFIENPQQRAIIDALGYQQLNGELTVAGSWQPETGRVTVAPYDIKVDNAGTLGLALDFSGYTPDFIASLRELQQQAANAGADEDSAAQSMAMMGLVQQLSLNSAEISFTDDSLTRKALDVAGAQQGLSASDTANMIKGTLPFLLAQLGSAELSKEITEAVSTFLDDPRNLRIAAAPAQPVPFAMVAAAGMVSPLELVRTLGVTVTANQ